MQIGEQKGVRLSHVLYVVAAQASGNDTKIRDALRSYAASKAKDKRVNPEFRLINDMVGQMIQGIVRYWIENTDVRATDNGMIQFWDEQGGGRR